MQSIINIYIYVQLYVVDASKYEFTNIQKPKVYEILYSNWHFFSICISNDHSLYSIKWHCLEYGNDNFLNEIQYLCQSYRETGFQDICWNKQWKLTSSIKQKPILNRHSSLSNIFFFWKKGEALKLYKTGISFSL